RDASMLSFEGSRIQGIALQYLPYERVEHEVTTLDAQPSSPGSLRSSLAATEAKLTIVDDSQNLLRFSQVLQLITDGGSYYVY
ncbi:hypothetical protein FA95DRAFT_1463500, partial [Auriscalpium vulgare]